MQRVRPLALLICSIAAPLAGCSKHDSTDVLTHGMYASITVTAEGDGSSLVATTLYFGQPIDLNFIELSGNDELLAVMGGQSQAMVKHDFLNVVSYTALFDSDADGTLFEVQFLRALDDGAPSSSCTLPQPFDLVNIPAAPVSRAAELSVDWDNTVIDEMRWSVDGDCIDPAGGTLGTDTGTLTLPPGTIVKSAGDGVQDSCLATLSITRSRAGMIDPGFGEGGDVECRHVRSMTFTSAP